MEELYRGGPTVAGQPHDGAVPAAAPSGPAEPPASIEFTGDARQYFGIWFVNITFSILTLGVYSAWGKVRRNRYLLGHTIVLGDALRYHATGPMILKGRLIGASAVAILALLQWARPDVGAVAVLTFLPVLPWAVNRALAFRARVVSWRNVHFGWHGSYWGTARAYVLWPLAGLLTLGALAPLAGRAQREYEANNLTWGRTPFSAATRIGSYYRAGLGAAALVAVAVAAIVSVFSVLGDSELLDDLAIALLVATWLAALWLFRVASFHVVLDGLRLHERASFSSSFGAMRYFGIAASNLALVVVTMFLASPWARIRAWRYRTECTSIAPSPRLGTPAGGVPDGAHAWGEELDEMASAELSLW